MPRSLRHIVIAAGVAVSATTGVVGQDTPSAEISGYVFAGDTGLPIAAATVRLAGGGAAPRRTNADEAGRFVFPDNPVGRYVLTAVKDGYATGTSGQQRPGDVPSSFAVRAGGSQTADIWLTPLGTISGQVLDDASRPVEGITIRALRRATQVPGGRAIFPLTTTSDQNGEFKIARLPSGNYYVSATTGPQAAPTYYPGTLAPEQAEVVRVDAGVEVRTPITLRRGGLVRISGRVIDSNGAPATTHVVLLSGRPPLLPPSPGAFPFAEVDRDGRFTLPAVAPGDYQLDARSRVGFENIAARGGGGIGQVSRIGEFAARRITVASDALDIVMQTTPGHTVSGRLTVRGGSIASLGTLRLTALPSADDSPALSGFLLLGDAAVRADGSFRFENLSGSKVIRPASLPDGWALERVGAGGADVTDRGIDIWADTVIDVVIGRQTEVAGQVVDADDGPIPGVPVVVFAEDRLLWTLPRSRYVSVSVAGADGRFRVTGLPPGRYRAAAVFEATEGQIVDVESLGQFVPRATNFAVARGERVSIRVRVR